MTIKAVEVKVIYTTGEPKTFAFNQTSEPHQAKDGTMTRAIFQPSPDNPAIESFTKIYCKAEEAPKGKPKTTKVTKV